MYQEFDDFIEQQRVKFGLLTTNFEKRKEEWLKTLNTFHHEIKSILEPYIEDRRIVYIPNESNVTESELGTYLAPAPRIALSGDANSQVILEPVGTFILGAKGRVDMVNFAGRKMRLLLVNKNMMNSRHKIIPPSSTQLETEGNIEWVWKIEARPPDNSLLEFTERNFLNALMFVMKG